MAEKKQKRVIPWADIKAEYRLDVMSNRQLALKYEIAESTLRARIKKENWTKDLAKQVSSLVQDKVARLVGNEVRSDSEENLVEQVADEKVGIITGHRKTLTDLHEIIGLLGTRLKEQLGRDRLVVELAGRPVEIDIPLDYVGKVTGQLSKSIKDMIEMSRKTYGLDEKDEGEGSYDEQLVKILDEMEKVEKGQHAN